MTQLRFAIADLPAAAVEWRTGDVAIHKGERLVVREIADDGMLVLIGAGPWDAVLKPSEVHGPVRS